MKRFFISAQVIIGIVIAVYFFGRQVFEFPMTHDYIRDIVESRLSHRLSRDVQISKITGSIFSNVELLDLVISDPAKNSQWPLARVARVSVSLRPMVIFNAMKGVDDILFDGVILNVVRDKKKKVNVLEFVRQISHQSSKKYPELTLRFHNISGQYLDMTGWGRSPQLFRHGFHGGEASIAISSSSVELNAALLFTGSDAQGMIRGGISNNEFYYNFEVTGLAADRWGPYLVPTKAVSVTDDMVTVRGELRNSNGATKAPFFYDIHVLFDYLTLTIAHKSQTFKNINGNIQLVNYQRPQLRLDTIVAEYNDIPMKASGAIYFDSKTYDILVQPQQSLTPDMMPLDGNHLFPEQLMFNAFFEFRLKGPFKQPVFYGDCWSDSLVFSGRDLGALYLNLTMSRDGLFVRSLDTSDIFVDGHVVNDRVELDVHLDDVVVPLVKQVIPLKFRVEGLVDQPMVSLAVSDIDWDFLGYQVLDLRSKVQISADFWQLPDLTIQLINGQALTFEAKYAVNEQRLGLNQTGLTQVSMIQHAQRIDAMSSELMVYQNNGLWESVVTANISGVGARIFDLDISEYSIQFKRHGRHDELFLHRLHSNAQQLQGRMAFHEGGIQQLDIEFSDIDLSEFNGRVWSQFPFYSLDLFGRITGRVTYDKQSQVLDARLDINDFRTVHGQFGDLFLDIARRDEVINVNQFKFRGLHHANLTGTFLGLEDFNLFIASGSMFRLDAFDYFSRLNVLGHAKVSGELSRSQGTVRYEGTLESDDLIFDDNRFDYLFAQAQLDEGALLIDHSVVEFGAGRMTLRGALPFSESALSLLNSEQYDFSIVFRDFDLEFLSQLIFSYQKLTHDDDVLSYLPQALDQSYAYHQYQWNNLSIYNQYVDQLKGEDAPLRVFGILDGMLTFNGRQFAKNTFDLRVQQFKWLDKIEMASLSIKSKDLSPETKQFVVSVDTLKLNGAVMTHFESDIMFFSNEQRWTSFRQHIVYQGQVILNPFQWTYEDQLLDLTVQLPKDHVNLLSFPFSAISSLKNDGDINANIQGPLTDLKVLSGRLKLRNFELAFNENASVLNSSFKIDSADLPIRNGQVYFDDLTIHWTGGDTFRRVTRERKTNALIFSGDLSLDTMDFLDHQWVQFTYDMSLSPGFFSVNFPQVFSGDIESSQLRLSGTQQYPFSTAGRLAVQSTLGTANESGPVLTGRLLLKDGVFNMPSARSSKRYVRLGLDMEMVIGPGNYIQGSIFGDGIYNLANYISLEIDPRMEKDMIPVKGTVNAPNVSARIPFYEGTVTILDGVYDLIRKEEQLHYFKYVPEYVSDQYVVISPVKSQHQTRLHFDMHLRGLRKQYDARSTQDVRYNELFPYSAVGLVLDGDFRDITSAFTVLDFALESHVLSYPQYEFLGAYNVQLSDQQEYSHASNYGLNLVMPGVITDTENTTFTQYGRQQVNNFVKSSIRPYERRLARRFGFYDFRIDYDFGRKVFASSNDVFFQQDLLGLNLVSNLHKEKVFLTVRTDVDLSSDEATLSDRGFKLTQVELKYFFEPNFSVGLKNINEYSDVTTFDPRWSINYGYVF